MSYYDTFLAINKNSVGDMLAEEYQEVINENFENSTTFHNDIGIEEEFGTLIFTNTSARITTLIDNKTGEKISDDYRKIIFQNFNYKPLLGQRFYFDDNVWIVCSINNIKSLTSSAYLRRCNNTINTIDKYGNIHREPCVVDCQSVRANKIEEEKLTIPSIYDNLICQYNKWTVNFDINSRLMFDSRAYKIYKRQAYDKRETFADNNPYIMSDVANYIESDTNNDISYADIENVYEAKLIKYYFNFDNTNEYDNKELDIADYYMPKYVIKFNMSNQYQLNFEGIAEANVFLNENITDESIYWYSADESILQIDKITGAFKTLQLGTVKIIAKMVNNESFSTFLEIEIVENLSNIYKNYIVPNINRILLGREVEFEVYETLNNTKIDTSYTIEFSNMDDRYFEATKNGNKFIIKNIKPNTSQVLNIKCTNNRDNSQIIKAIELGGLY